MFSLRVEFPSGHYLAACSDNPAQPEWPPHPARLYSALVAAAYRSSGGMTDARRESLEWLEAQAAPGIFAPAADLLAAPLAYVPPGDRVERKGKRGEEKYEHPVHRWRQPRHFPEVHILGEPFVQYFWHNSAPQETFAALHEIAQGVTHVGTSHSMALVRPFDLAQDAELANLVPDDTGTLSLRTTTAGRLAELNQAYEQRNGVRRPLPVCEALTGYRATRSRHEPVRRHEMLCLAIEGVRYGLADSQILMRATRTALMGAMQDDAPAALHGHGDSPHLAWLPLADVGHRYASGTIAGIGLALPVTLSAQERHVLLQGLARLPFVRLPDGREIRLRAIPLGRPVTQTLQQRTWCAPSHVWATISPVVLDRPPRKADEKQVRDALVESLQLAGFPEPEAVEFSTHSVFAGTPYALDFPSATPRFHALVRFPELVAGPIIAGRQRNFGVGFFRPLQAQAIAT